MTVAALRVTKCRLCGQPSAGPGGLCADCSRALARAREGPAALRSGSGRAARKPRVVERIVLTSPVDPEPARSPKKAGAALWATIGVIVVAVALAFTAGLSPQNPIEVKVSERPARVVPQLLEPPIAGDPAEADANASPPDKAFEPPALPNNATAAPAPQPARKTANARPATDSKRASDASRVTPAEPPPSLEPPVQQARANVAPSSAPVDESQAFASALEKCNEEKFLAGVICEQKVRLRYCEGKWGQVPQCTKKPHVD